jgi:hypothetical protein
MAQKPGWFRGMVGAIEPEPPEAKTLIGSNERNLQDRANDITICQQRIIQKTAELQSAEADLKAKVKAFSEHCVKLGLPIEITEQPWPQAPYEFEE